MGLIIGRAKGESFTVGEAKICFLGLDEYGEARLLIEAPKHVAVVRDDAVKREPRSRDTRD